MQKLTIALLGLAAFFVAVEGHGRLVKPAGRATLWRYPEFQQYNPESDYNDNQLFCGGFYTQHTINGGKCGVCGDSYSDPQPREHEGGGKYGKGIITGSYSAGAVIEVGVDLTASHKGYFEFRICPHNSPFTPASQECLDQYVLQLADGSGTRYPINHFKEDERVHSINVKLPDGVTCEQCVFQWHYTTGNGWGVCEDGSGAVGCGDQETFRGCADITIS